MIDAGVVDRVLDAYVECFVPAMLRWRYHLILAKGGPEYAYLPEQSLFAHIINGVFSLAELVKFLVEHRVVPSDDLDETTFRKALALYSIHEVHKSSDFEKMDKTEFSIPLERLSEEYERLGLNEFVSVDEHLMRAANVHKRSFRQGDLLLSQDNGSLLWLLVRLADNFASAKDLNEARASLMGYLKDLGPAFAAKSPPGKYALYYHQIKDVRGVLTNTIHQAVVQQLQADYGFFPLLYFATGTLYLGPTVLNAFEREKFIEKVISTTLKTFGQLGDIKIAQRRQNYDFQPYVYAFADVPMLLDLVRDDTLAAKPEVEKLVREDRTTKERTIGSDFEGLLNKKDLPKEWNARVVIDRFALSLGEPRIFNEHWARARRYLFYVDKMLRALNPAENAMAWFLTNFPVPKTVTTALSEVGELWAKGGPGKYVVPVAYHFLKGPAFAGRAAKSLPAEEVLEKLHKHVLAALEQVDTMAGRQATVAQLGFRQDLTAYLEENLYLSFSPETPLADDSLAAYVVPKKKGHSNRMCSLCNRQSEYVQELRTGILDDFGRVFSNRVLPALEAPGGNRPWCPICHLEFIFRKLTGLGLPEGAHYKNSYRIYLYVLPTFSFTSEHLRLFRPLLRPFTQVTNLPLRDYGQDWGVPHYWLERRELDPDWIEELMAVLNRQVAWISDRSEWSYGERVVMSRVRGQPHYYLITWEKRAGGSERDDARIATRTEAWAKALFAAVIISGLTSCKVYVTERPYLPVVDPSDLKPSITLDSPPPALRGLLAGQTDAISLYGRERNERSGLERVLNLSAALWTVTADVHAPNRPTKDKYIADRLGLLNVSPLAGATFYKEYSRLNDGQSPYRSLDIACKVLLEVQGGELMDLVEQIAEKALKIGLPLRGKPRGKAHRYELVFREGVDAMRKAFDVIPELRRAAVTGQPPPDQSVAELKHLASGTLLKAMPRKRSDVFVNPWGKDLGRLAGEFLDILVDDVFLDRAGGSFARFLRLENSLADGVYYYTDRNLSRLWDKYNQQKAARQAEAATSP